MLTNALSAKQVKNATDGKFRDGQGLQFEVKGGSRRWIFACMMKGQRMEIALGKYPAMSLAAARELRAKLIDAKDHGIDPRTILKPATVAEPAKTVTFRDDMDAFYEKKHRQWDVVHARVWKNSLVNHAASLMVKPTGSLTDADVLEVVKPLWTTKHHTASDILGRIRDIIEYATGIEPERFSLPNPTVRARLLLPDGVKPKTVNLPAMAIDDLPAFYARLAQREEIEAKALRFMLLNGCPRTAEILCATWGEIEGDLWTVQGDRTKNVTPRTNRQTAEAMAILASIRPSDVRPDMPIFPALDGGFKGHNSMLNLLQRDMGHEHLTIHGFRTSFTGWVKKNHRRYSEEAEKLLDHKTTGKLGTAYDREDLLDERFQLCQWWAEYLTSQITDTALAA